MYRIISVFSPKGWNISWVSPLCWKQELNNNWTNYLPNSHCGFHWIEGRMILYVLAYTKPNFHIYIIIVLKVDKTLKESQKYLGFRVPQCSWHFWLRTCPWDYTSEKAFQCSKTQLNLLGFVKRKKINTSSVGEEEVCWCVASTESWSQVPPKEHIPEWQAELSQSAEN